MKRKLPVSLPITSCLCCLALFLAAAPCSAKSENKDYTAYPEADWGIGVTVRTATIAFDTNDESVSSFVPLLFYDGRYFFLNGFEGGIKLISWKDVRFDLLGRLRFFDIPEEFQNRIQGDTVDAGARINYSLTDEIDAALEILSDDDARTHGNIRLTYAYQGSDVDIAPYFNVRFTSSEFNSYYYGLERIDAGSGTEFSLGLTGKYHLYRNLYAIGRLQSTWLDNEIRNIDHIDRDRVDEMYLGFALFNERHTEKKSELSLHPYVRIAHGWATTSNLSDILSGNTESDPYNNQLTSIFYGHPLTDELFGLPLDIYLTPGFVWHWDSEVQDPIQEYVVALKMYLTLTWPCKWRFGVAEGVSYVSEVTYIERTEMERKGYEPSNLMNYLDFTLDVELGNLLHIPSLANVYLGYSIHHRSSIFESASQFGRIKGGSNYNTVYLQYHF